MTILHHIGLAEYQITRGLQKRFSFLRNTFTHTYCSNMEERKRSVTVAIDFGTTYSGFGFAEANVSGESGIQVFRGWGRGQGFSFYKTPTSVLLAPDGNFSKFGHAAVEAYAKNLAKGNNQDIIYFERFKLVLYNTKASGLFTLSRPAHGYLLSQLLLIS